MPTMFPNFRSVVRHTPAEKRLLRKYAVPGDEGTVLYTGCYSLGCSARKKSFSSAPPA